MAATNLYNYYGIGYDGIPAPVTSEAWIFDVQKQHWRMRIGDSLNSMVHRGSLFTRINNNYSWWYGNWPAGFG